MQISINKMTDRDGNPQKNGLTIVSLIGLKIFQNIVQVLEKNA